MKYKTTRKAIVNSYAEIISVPYCDLQHLLSCSSPVAYTCGTYGWNFDVYEIEGVALCTGYRGMPGRKANNIKEYESRAKAICNNWAIKYDEQKTELEKLLREFIAQA